MFWTYIFLVTQWTISRHARMRASEKYLPALLGLIFWNKNSNKLPKFGKFQFLYHHSAKSFLNPDHNLYQLINRTFEALYFLEKSPSFVGSFLNLSERFQNNESSFLIGEHIWALVWIPNLKFKFLTDSKSNIWIFTFKSYFLNW